MIRLLPLNKPQQIGLDRFMNHYYTEKNDRGILAACCGSGKTYLFYNIMKECLLHNDSIFVYVTSRLVLIDQLVKNFSEWIKIDNIDILIVTCSSVKIQGIDKMDETRLLWKLNENINKKILIITTYDSSDKVYKCFKCDKTKIIDMIVFDEAHHTTGQNMYGEAKDTQILCNINNEICVRKYLYMTGTPIFLTIPKIKRTTHASIFTMSNKTIYGEVFYEYSFYNGISDGIIVDFEVIYIKQTCKQKTKKYNPVYDLDEIVRISQEKYQFKRMIIYMNSIKDIHNIIEKFKIIYHESQLGIITSKDRNYDKLVEFNNLSDKFMILFTVNIFNEGYDVPICDCICFAQDRCSETTIVQNIGRALRVHTNKSKAYIIIPEIICHIDDLHNSSNSYIQIRKMLDKLRIDQSIVCNKKINPAAKFMLETPKLKGTRNRPEYISLDENGNDFEIIESQLESTTELIGNKMDYSLLKNYIRKYNIKTLKELKHYNDKLKLKSLLPHLKYNVSDGFISYDVLFNETQMVSYSDAKDIINSIKVLQPNVLRSNTDYNSLYNRVISDEYNLIENDDAHTIFLLDLIYKLPAKPVECYRDHIFDWNDFLSVVSCIPGVTRKMIVSNSSGISGISESSEIRVNKKPMDLLTKNEYVYDDLQVFYEYFKSIEFLRCKQIDDIKVHFYMDRGFCLKDVKLVGFENKSQIIIINSHNYSYEYNGVTNRVNNTKVRNELKKIVETIKDYLSTNEKSTHIYHRYVKELLESDDQWIQSKINSVYGLKNTLCDINERRKVINQLCYINISNLCSSIEKYYKLLGENKGRNRILAQEKQCEEHFRIMLDSLLEEGNYTLFP